MGSNPTLSAMFLQLRKAKTNVGSSQSEIRSTFCPPLSLAQHRRIVPADPLLVDADDLGEFPPVGLDVIVGMKGGEVVIREAGGLSEVGVAEAGF